HLLRDRRLGTLPTESPGDHQMDHQEQLVGELEDDPLSDPAQPGDLLAHRCVVGRVVGAEHGRRCDANAGHGQPEHPLLQGVDVDGDIGQLGHTARLRPWTSPPWSGSGTGEHRRRRGGGASEASQEPHRGFPAVLRTAPPRHFVPLPHSANRFVGEKSSAPAAGPSNTSPPWSGSGTGEHRRRRGGGASEANQETTVISLRSYGPPPLGPACHPPTPPTASWGRQPPPQRPGRPTPLPRGAGAERGRPAGGGEGAPTQRGRNPTVDSLRSSGPRPLGTSCHSPTPLT